MPLALTRNELFAPYVPRLVRTWLAENPAEISRQIEGTAVFVDVSGFTRLSERLSRRGKIGAEELAATINECFSSLLAVAWDYGGILLKFGGDALLLFFTGDQHELAGTDAAVAMRQTLRERRRVDTSAGVVPLRMSVGVHTGLFNFFLLGTIHRELVITGPAATTTVQMENIASAGEIVLSSALAQRLPDAAVGDPKNAGFKLRRAPGGNTHRGSVLLPPEARTDISTVIPLAIREHLIAGGDEPEHRHVTIAFVHFDDVDAAIKHEGADATAAALESLVDEAQIAARGHGVTFLGTDIDRDGGKIILVAGAPNSSADDEERMLAALGQIVGHDRRLPVRIGVNSGRVFAGDIGAVFRRTFTVMGDAVNLAARLMAAAPAGEILATAGVLERSRTEFRATPLPPFKVKGKIRPVQAFSVGEAVAQHSSSDNAPLPLVGRETEMRTLQEALLRARQGSGGLVEIVGDAGVGKSRLVAELCAMAAHDMTTLTVRSRLYESHTSYASFRQLLRQVLEVGADDDNETVAQRLQARVERDAWEFVAWLPLLGVLLDVTFPATPETEALDDQFRKTKTEEVVVQFLTYALSSPTLLVFEDAHWMDESSDALLRRLLTAVEQQPWLVCVARGNRGRRPLDDSARTLLELAPLDVEHAAALAVVVTEEQPLAPHALDEIVERAGGNPLFLLTMLDAASAARGGELPDSVEAVLAASIDRLPAGDRRLLREAAVLGSEFSSSLLEAVIDEPRDAARLTRGSLRDFVRRDDAGVIHFHHELARDVAYEGLPYRRRRELHQRVGEEIERRAAVADDEAEVLSLHFLSSEDNRKAWHYSCLAGDRASAKYATIDAARFYERALEAARKVDGLPVPEVARVAQALGDARDRAGLYDAASAAFKQARELLANDPVAQARLALKHARIADRLGRYTLMVRWIRRGQRSLVGVDGVDAMSARAELDLWYAGIRQLQGRYAEAERACRDAMALAEAACARDCIAQGYALLDWILVDQRRRDEAVYSPRALAIYEALGDLHGQATVLNNLGAWACYAGHWDEGMALLERSRALSERAGAAVDAAFVSLNIAEILSDQGHQAEAITLLRQARRVSRAAGDAPGMASADSLLGRALCRAGDPAAGLELLEHARAQFVELGPDADVLAADTRIAECLLALGRARECEERVDAALKEDETSRLVPTLHRLRGLALVELDERVEARVELEEALRAARTDDNAYEVGLTLASLAELADGDDCASLRAASERILGSLAVVSPPAVIVRQHGDSSYA
jgi:class 3 adenylate cyclase/tetratricopeptide (TPR) repeat protein